MDGNLQEVNKHNSNLRTEISCWSERCYQNIPVVLFKMIELVF